jgi:hypothetical protein
MTVIADEIPTLVTIAGVELVTVGDWDASTGPVTFTPEHLAAAVAALDDPAIHAPRLRIGHTSPTVPLEGSAGGFEEQPAFGRFVNLRLNAAGTSIVADIAGVPAWLAEILPSAFPSRSVEAYFNVVTATGRTHDMVIPSVALLGVSMPAVQTLEDLRLAFGAEMPDGVQMFVSGDRVAATRKEGAMPKRISASVAYEDVRQSFYLDFAEGDRYWWWIYKSYVDPAVMIADDDEGGYWAVPYTVSGDKVAWGDPYEVEMQWVAKDGGKVVASAAAKGSDEQTRVYASAAESRPKDRVRTAAAPVNEGGQMLTDEQKKLAAKLGLGDDATVEQLHEKLQADALAAIEDPETPEAPAVELPVAASVDPDALKQLQEDARLGREAREQQVRAEREEIVDERIKGGFITAASRAGHLAELAKGGEIEKAHRDYLANLTAAIVPVDERGVTPADETAGEEHALSQIRASFGIATTTPKERS